MPRESASAASVSSSAARVWITTGFPSSAASSSCGGEEPPLVVGRRVVAEPVEPGLADRDRLRMREQLAQRGEIVRRRRPRLVRVDAEDREDAVVPLGELERAAAVRRRSCRR